MALASVLLLVEARVDLKGRGAISSDPVNDAAPQRLLQRHLVRLGALDKLALPHGDGRAFVLLLTGSGL